MNDNKQDNIKIEETSHLGETLEKVKDGKKAVEKSLEVLGLSNLDRLKELRESGMDAYNPDFFFFMEELNEKNQTLDVKGKYARLTEFDFMLDQPYFARIDLINSQANETQQLYIGKFGYTHDKPIITDWRTKIASIYYRYRYPQKNVEYDTPAGKVISDLKLKRTFEIENGELIKYFNNDIQLDEKEIIIEKIETRTGGVLEDIIETIQMSQLDIIEADPRQVCVVQGCVGSGKSTVAIHKLAHIFFNYPNLIHPHKSILIAKNQILVGYLSTLFPKLGIFDIQYKTVRELLINILFREEINLQYDLELHQNTNIYPLRRIQDIMKRINSVHDEYEEKLKDLFDYDEEFKLFSSYKYSRNITPYQNIDDILTDLQEEIANQKESIKLHPDSVDVWLWKENLKILRRLTQKLQKLKTDLKSKILEKIALSEGLPIYEKMGYREVLLYLYVYAELIGVTKYPLYEYCVVDEGQDFSVLEYAFLGKVVLRGRFSILGDLNQTLEEDGLNSWDEITEVIKEAKSAVNYQLDTNYRSTKPIIDYANKVLAPYTDKYLPKSINRRGAEPIANIYDSYDELISAFELEINQDIKEINKSVGIICFNEGLFDEVNKRLSSIQLEDGKYIVLNPNTTIRYIPKGVYLMNMRDCKGLEFSKVYILGLNIDQIASYDQAREAFVAITRAMNELSIYGLK